MNKTQQINNTDVKKVLTTRTITFSSEFTRESIESVISLMNKIERFDKIVETPKDKLKIRININSFGGSVYALYSILDHIELFKNKGYIIQTHNYGVAMSCGFLLAISGSYKTCSTNATYLNHQMSSLLMGTVKDMELSMTEIKRMEDRCNDYIRKHTFMSDEEIMKPYNTNSDIYYNSDEALHHGICDKILY